MLTKQSIVAALGEQALALPRLVNEGLAANDRFKYRLSLLQLARRHAEAPNAPIGDLRPERVAAQIEDTRLDELPAACTRSAVETYRLPGLEALLTGVASDVRTMLAPILIAQAAGAEPAEASITARAETLLPPLLHHRDAFTTAELDRWAHVERERGDSVHLLVMDLHHRLNSLQQAVATEVLDGASVWPKWPRPRAAKSTASKTDLAPPRRRNPMWPTSRSAAHASSCEACFLLTRVRSCLRALFQSIKNTSREPSSSRKLVIRAGSLSVKRPTAM